MTALYAILAVMVLGGIMLGAYLIGFEDGVEAERIRRSICIESRTVTLDTGRRRRRTWRND